ncbi:MAG: pyrroline-5-carboxylate reductase [Desulfobacterales bacterium]|nr:pyrroline-5-carboxylate reductase [Desulfobacterales bacterium]MDD4072782.1 pyrroline-5-carboxylate reductase [Desulfobacterales bacterium]MDD4392079.1 pyrroline-5-carboxylate reductase [Desulfobacterales bacterium]
MLDKKIGFIGAGNMAEAIIGAIIQSKICTPSLISVSDINQERVDFITEKYGVNPADSNTVLFSESRVIILAVKPQHLAAALSQIAAADTYRISERKLIISIAAGFPIKKIEADLYAPLDSASKNLLPIIRVMPNTPALVLAGISGISMNAHATQEDIVLARSILESMGQVIEFEEKMLDVVTAVSGSGPAYVFFLIESMIQAGIALGLTAGQARILTIQTVKGAVKLLEELDEAPETLRKKVTSPGGTTEAALNILNQYEVKNHIIQAIDAAAKRSTELSR